MPDVTWMPFWYSWVLRAVPLESRSIIDLGCGRGIMGALCRIYREPQRLVGVDIFEPYLEFCRKLGLYDELVMWDLQKIPLPFAEREFDVCICTEVLEHLPKLKGEELLDEMERIASQIIVTTPNLFFVQPEYDGNPWQKHVSRWSVRDFRRRGYRVFGIGGLKVLGKRVRYVSTALSMMTFWMPQISDTILAIKGFSGWY
jgi:2-polyprenyl-3-methyl-5-hydroxy-6-metoxy-1,4-benzoquinol methylase